MPGSRLYITGADRKALKSFFNNKMEFDKANSTYMDLANCWKSLSEISTELKESRQRTKKRLEKLKGLGFVELEVIPVGKRTDLYWYISRTGIYYMLSILKGPKLVRFLQSNNKIIEEFVEIEKLLLSSKPEFSHLIHQIKYYSKNHQYHEIIKFVQKWLRDVFGRNFRVIFLPSLKYVIMKNYQKKTIKELEKTYGRIL
jgi:hypothetical protein